MWAAGDNADRAAPKVGPTIAVAEGSSQDTNNNTNATRAPANGWSTATVATPLTTTNVKPAMPTTAQASSV
jgi:hypothetical protein